MRTAILFFFVASLATRTSMYGQSLSPSATQNSQLIPQNLLRLVHAPEVHQELAFSAEQVESLERFFGQVDGIWFRARVLPADKQQAIIADLEGKLKIWLTRNATPDQRSRVQQLEYRSLGVRMLLRSDVGKQLELTESQRAQLSDLAEATNQATADLHKANISGAATEQLKTAVIDATSAEQAAWQTVLRSEQLQKLPRLLGEPFDTHKLERIYPMAPELVPVEHWINSQPLKLKDLRGKVVVVHFYAFQCHNCHANFGHYNKWQEEFPSNKVALIGIQTPETSREREPNAVRAAAVERGFKFPVLIDLESANWKAWSNTMWPTVYVIDKRGYIRYVWQGELNWNGATQDETIHDLIEKLIAEDVAT